MGVGTEWEEGGEKCRGENEMTSSKAVKGINIYGV